MNHISLNTFRDNEYLPKALETVCQYLFINQCYFTALRQWINGATKIITYDSSLLVTNSNHKTSCFFLRSCYRKLAYSKGKTLGIIKTRRDDYFFFLWAVALPSVIFPSLHKTDFYDQETKVLAKNSISYDDLVFQRSVGLDNPNIEIPVFYLFSYKLVFLRLKYSILTFKNHIVYLINGEYQQLFSLHLLQRIGYIEYYFFY